MILTTMTSSAHCHFNLINHLPKIWLMESEMFWLDMSVLLNKR